MERRDGPGPTVTLPREAATAAVGTPATSTAAALAANGSPPPEQTGTYRFW